MVLLQHALGQTANKHFDYSIIFALNHVHVIVFFVISGYIFEMQRYKLQEMTVIKFVKKKFVQLIVPYCFWSFFLALCVKFFYMFNNTSAIMRMAGYEPWEWKEILYNILTFNKYYVQHLWFIYVLFLYFIINYFSGSFFSKWKGYIAGLIIIGILFEFNSFGFIVSKFFLHILNFSFGRVIYNYGYEKHITSRKLTIASIIVIVSLYLSEYFIVDSVSYSFVGQVVWGIAGTILVAQFSNYFISVSCEKSKLKMILSTIGDYSYDIYLIHNPYILGFAAILLKKLGLNSVLVIIIAVLLGVFIPIMLSKYSLRKSKILSTIMLGKTIQQKTNYNKTAKASIFLKENQY
jgi:peptidoglycan/LPS O-acetylase OafA/YrhL